MTDQLLLQAIVKGDNTAFEKLFRQYFKVLSVYALKYTHDLDLAQGLTQDVFVKLYEKKDTLDVHTSLKSFLFTAVRNRCLDHIKTNKIRNNHKDLIKDELAGGEVDHTELILQTELEEKVYQAINTLPDQRMKIFKLSRIEGKSNQEIATALNISKRTVETHISNALKNLKTKLTPYLNLFVIIMIKICI